MTAAMLAQHKGEALDPDSPATSEAVAVVADQLHEDCAAWSWSSHSANYHEGAARRILMALVEQGWQHQELQFGGAAGAARTAG